MLLKQILKVPYVISADDITKTPYVERELMLIKIVCDRKQRGELVDLCANFRAKIVDVSENTATIEAGGRQKKIIFYSAFVRTVRHSRSCQKWPRSFATRLGCGF